MLSLFGRCFLVLKEFCLDGSMAIKGTKLPILHLFTLLKTTNDVIIKVFLKPLGFLNYYIIKKVVFMLL